MPITPVKSYCIVAHFLNLQGSYGYFSLKRRSGATCCIISTFIFYLAATCTWTQTP